MTRAAERHTPLPGSGVLVPGRPALRVGPLSTVRRLRAVAVPLVLLGLALLLLAVSTARGDYPLPLLDVVQVLLGGGEPRDRFVVVDLRLPRALTGALVGVALGASGALTQSLARNPLASPDVLGITWGAAAAAVAVLVLGLGDGLGVPLAALLGGLGTAAVVLGLGARGGLSGLRVVLVGVGVSAVMRAVVDVALVRGELVEVTQAQVWITGSLGGRGWEHVVPVALAVAVCLAGVLALAPALAALRLSEDTARALGTSVTRSRGLLLLLAVVLAAAATAAAGPVLFVALVAPQIALRLVRSAGPPVLASGLVGAVLLLAADLVTRTALPTELPVGVLTAVIGAPYLLHLIVTRARRATA